MLMTLQKFLIAQHTWQSDSFSRGNITIVAENFLSCKFDWFSGNNNKLQEEISLFFWPFWVFFLNNYTYFCLNWMNQGLKNFGSWFISNKSFLNFALAVLEITGWKGNFLSDNFLRRVQHEYFKNLLTDGPGKSRRPKFFLRNRFEVPGSVIDTIYDNFRHTFHFSVIYHFRFDSHPSQFWCCSSITHTILTIFWWIENIFDHLDDHHG